MGKLAGGIKSYKEVGADLSGVFGDFVSSSKAERRYPACIGLHQSWAPACFPEPRYTVRTHNKRSQIGPGQSCYREKKAPCYNPEAMH